MKKYLVQFLKRGMMFGGFGPIIAGIIYFILSFSISDFSLSGTDVLLAIVSTYALAFLQAGASVFNQIEHWPISKSLCFHLATIYLAYVLCYLVNSWIPFNWVVILVFTAIFLVTYLIIWLTVYLIIKKTSNNFNKKLSNI